VRPVAYCENDQYVQGVLLSRMATGELPTAPIWDDVRSLWARDLPRVDIIYGGFPCQDISVAGRGRGLDGERSGLFYEIARLVGEIRPRFVFLENVPAIRSRGGAEIVGDLARLGYDCRWDVLSAYDVGAPHLRERWWILAYTTSGKRQTRAKEPRKVLALHGNQREHDNTDRPSENMANASKPGLEKREGPEGQRTYPSAPGSGWWSTEPHVGRVAHGIPARVDRLRGLGNAVVPAQAREAFRRLMGF
jgi:DNA (cytosine-5)-methyltransferase 1